MSDVKTWAEIDASPLLHLPPEERAQLQQSHDERFRAFWADCFQAMLASRKGSDEEMADRFGNAVPFHVLQSFGASAQLRCRAACRRCEVPVRQL
mgnify:CR=1 FL=1